MEFVGMLKGMRKNSNSGRFGKGTTLVVPISPFLFVIPSGLQPARDLLS
jgi:hypothetical protein